MVDEYLRAPGHEHVYVIGDNSLVFNAEGGPYPPTAQIAMQQGVNCAKNVVASIRNKQPQPFEFTSKGTVASLGKGRAIAVVGGKKYKGWKAAQLKKLVDLRYSVYYWRYSASPEERAVFRMRHCSVQVRGLVNTRRTGSLQRPDAGRRISRGAESV